MSKDFMREGFFSEIMSRKQIADCLRISTRTLDRHVNEKRIPSFTIGKRRLFNKAEVLTALQGGDR